MLLIVLFCVKYRSMFTSLNEANAALEQKDLQIQELAKKLESTQLTMKKLQHQIEQLLRRVYGKRSEKIDPRQMVFDSFFHGST